MQPASAGLARAIDTANVRDAAIPIIGNIDATPLTASASIRVELAQQIASSVQWVRIIEHLTDAGVTVFCEIGPGQALTGMVKRIARIAKGVTTINIGNMAEMEKAVDLVREMSLALKI